MTQEGIDQIRLAKVVEELKQIENAILKGGNVEELIKLRYTLLDKKRYYEAKPTN